MAFKTLIGVDSLAGLEGDPRLVVVDCRFDLADPGAGLRAYLRAHIPGALYADLDRDLSAPIGPLTGRHPLPAPEAFAAGIAKFGIGDDTQVVAYDDANGSIAARLWWMLRWVGHDAVAVLDGGFKAWTAQGGAVEAGEATAHAKLSARADPADVKHSAVAKPLASRTAAIGTANANANANAAAAAAVVTTAELEQSLRDPAVLLVDARAPERFAGKVEPIDAVAGHLPGAVNHPFTANLDAGGCFLPAAELERRWRLRLGDTAPENVIAMCGSGVTACHDLLSLEVAGLTGARLYAGSWSEWIRDPRRPVAAD
jgi:thiosulfate/3-mercaptopyruvate sulfurtransferase